MGIVALIACIALGAVFMVSGIAKLMDRVGTREAVAGFGVAQSLTPFVAASLAPAELLVAALLFVPATAGAGLLLAVLLLTAFTGAVIFAMLSGRRPECHCFGRIGGADVSGRTVIRNGLLMALAGLGFVGWASAERPLDAATAPAVIFGAALALILIAAEGAAGRAARRAREQADEEAYEAGMAEDKHARSAPRFEAATLSGEDTSLAHLLAPGLPILVVFLSPGCGPCKTLRPAVSRWADVYRGRLTFAVVASGGAERNRAAYDGVLPPLPVILDDEDTIRPAYGVQGTPAAVLADPDGHLRGAVASGERLVRRLLAAALTGSAGQTALPDEPGSGVHPDSLGLTSIPRPRLTVTTHQLDGTTVLVNEADGASLALDQIGGIVWSVLDGASKLDEIVLDLAEAFGTPAEVVGPDVLEMVRALGRSGMLEGVAAEVMSDEVHPQSHEHAH